MSVAARVAREMGVKLGNEVRSVGTEGRGVPTLPTVPPPPHWSYPLSPSSPLREHQPLMAPSTGRLQHPL